MKSKHDINVIAFVLLFVAALFPTLLIAQSYSLSGKITDEKSRKPLAFANVVVNDGTTGCISDIDGNFSITASEPIRKVKVSSIGYETKEVDIQPDKQSLNVSLSPITIELQEVTVEAGENPAHRIIDSLMAHRKANNPNSLASYRYKIYDQMVFSIDSTEMGAALSGAKEGSSITKIDSILKKSDLMVMETASEVLFKSPDRKLQNVLGTKIAGMKNPTFIYLVNSMQSISFYEESINITGTDYVNPISRGSKYHYFFNLEAVSPMGHGDSLYVISFHPMLGSTFKGLRGTMTINSDGWALQSVKAEPNNQGGMFSVSIQQLYQKVENQWFPKQLNTNLKFSSVSVGVDDVTLSMVAIGKSYLTDIEINPEISGKQFSDIEIKVDPDAGFRDETFWEGHRIDTLTERVRATYNLVDSLTEGTDILDRVMGFTDKLLDETALSFGPLDLGLGRLVNYTVSKGWGFGLILSTNNRLSRLFGLKGFASYWTKQNYFEYGGSFIWRIDPMRQMQLELNVAHKTAALGEFNGMKDTEALLAEKNYKYTFYENSYVHSNCSEVKLSSRFAQHFKGFLGFKVSHRQYLRQFSLTPSDTLSEGIFAVAEAKLRFAYKEKFVGTTDGLRSLGTPYPIVWLSYQHAFPGIFGSSFEYDRFKMEATQNIYTPYMGVAKIVLQAGYATETCPVMETFDILGTYEPFGLYSPGSFSTMRFDEFFCDRFVALYLSHNFSGMLWKTNSPWFKPELTVVTNLGWGDMRRAKDCPEKNFKTMEKGYFESGFAVHGLLASPFAKIGVGVFYRYGPYAFDRVWDNFAFKWCVSFSL